MSITQFAMVEELAFLVRDNLRSKHLVLSMEEAFVNYLQDNTSSEGILELEPMDSYNRLLLHRLADIFGFSHESIGEGNDRHLVLEQCPETSIPAILVSDILWQSDEPQNPVVSHQLLRREESSPVFKIKTPSLPNSLEEREAAYLAARDRIFSMGDNLKEPNENNAKQKPRTDPVVARRMIAHALGQKINPCDQDADLKDCKEQELKQQIDELNLNFREKDIMESDSTARISQSTILMSAPHKTNPSPTSVSHCPERSIGSNFSSGRNNERLKREHLGATKRIFANALGMQNGKSTSTTNRVSLG